MTEKIVVPPYCYGAMERKAYRQFKSDRQWRWRFNRERFKRRSSQ